jgi:hypothetical protein
MSAFKNPNYTDRLSTSAAAKKALLEKFKARPTSEDPDVAKRMAERKAIREAREARNAEREAARRAIAEREAAEAAQRKATEEAERAAREAQEEAERAAREAARPKQIIRDVAAYAAMKAAGGRRR